MDFLRIAILLPWISRVGVTAHLPESEFVLREKSDPGHELRALPGVELGNDHAGRSAVLARQRGGVKRGRDEDVIIQAFLEGYVRRIAIVACEINEPRFRLRLDE